MDTINETICSSQDDTTAFALHFATQLKGGDCVALYGDLGAGKTFFVRGVCKALGIETGVRSPTFTLMNVYESVNVRVFHMDLYRLEDENEIYDIGYDDCCTDDGILFIEWPEKIENILPENVIRVYIAIVDDNARKISVKRSHA